MFENDRHLKCCRGLTLVEVLVAMVVMSFGVLGVLGAILLSSNVSMRSRHLDRAVTLANTKLEQAVCTTADKLVAQQGRVEQFTYWLSIENRPGGLKVATITIKWPEGQNIQKYTLSRIFMPAPPPEEEDEK